jgi:DNA-binding transcriptional LysR family regulator
MDAQPLEWSDLQLLTAVRGAGSMLGAARRLGLAASTVGRRMSALEGAVGTSLVDRGPAGVRLTNAGVALADCGAELELGVARVLRDLPRPGVALTGTIRISAGDGFADTILGAVRATLARHPGVRFELALEDRVVNLARREADVAVRTVNHRESTLVYRKVSALEYGLFANPRYLAERGAPRRLADLARHDWIGFAAPLDRLPGERWLRAQIARPPVLSVTTFNALLAASRAGLGLAALPVVSAAALAAVLPETELPSLPVWLVVGRDARKQPHIAAFVEVLRAEFERARAELPPRRPLARRAIG